jgi:hypothetical protein
MNHEIACPTMGTLLVDDALNRSRKDSVSDEQEDATVMRLMWQCQTVI